MLVMNGVAHRDDSRQWQRPPSRPIDTSKENFVMQQIELEEHSANGANPTIRMYGVTREGASALVHVTGFRPYLYVAAPPGFSDLDGLRLELNRAFAAFATGAVASVETVVRHDLWEYRHEKPQTFVRIVVDNLRVYTKIRAAFEDGAVLFPGFRGARLQTYESNIAYELRFMIDCKVVGMNWIECPASKYVFHTGRDKVSLCQYELSIDYNHLISHAPEDEWTAAAPLRLMSFDIECAGRKGIFPEPDRDPVIQIASVVSRLGEPDPFLKTVLTLGTCDAIAGVHVIQFDNEQDLLAEWQRMVENIDPDVVIGYNTANFDIPYLMDRAKALKVHSFPYLGRLAGFRSEVKETHFESRGLGARDSKFTLIPGRLQLDMLAVIQRDHKLRSYTLNAVSSHFLGEQKEDVHHSIITDLQNGTSETRRRLAVYCVKDAWLPLRLVDKLMTFINYSEMARVTGVPFTYLLSRGQQIKVISQLFRKAQASNYVVPSRDRMGGEMGEDTTFEGATVIDPVRGYYDRPIATLDFASLYPSIMQAHNLCYTTLTNATIMKSLGYELGKDYIITPNNDYFVTASRRKGLLPTILQDLLTARKNARAELKKESDPFKRAVLDGRQLALKVSANSVYGFTGATVGKLPCLPVSTSVTAFGRQMIDKTKEEVIAHFNTQNGYEHDAQVIYGDTDSVMVKFGCEDIETAMKLGAEAAAYVTKHFTPPIKLEFEKVYFPYLLMNKKRYAGLYWTRPEKWDKVDSKGLETVRRDNCRLVVTVIETCLKMLLIDRNVNGALDYAKKIIADLLQDKVDLSQLVISKALAKTDYVAKQPHVELAERMRQRDPGSAPALGDRVAYVFIKSDKQRAYERSEDPLYVLEHSLPIDTKYYLENQLSNPLMRVFEPILGDKSSSLLTGSHTHTVKHVTPVAQAGGLMSFGGFGKKAPQCLGCRATLRANRADKPVCDNCRPHVASVYLRYINKAAEAETTFARLWTQCQRCQGSLHQDVLCASSDCPIFYMRKKAQKDSREAVSTLERFDVDW